MNQPDGAGLWVFHGIRHTANRRSVVEVNDICEVRQTPIGPRRELACFFIGRSAPFRIDLMRGTWERAIVNLEGERQ